jgi:hypothetical protein
MRRLLPLLCLTLAGCSNAPIADTLDTCFPCRAKAGAGVDVKPKVPDPVKPAPPDNNPPLPPPDFGPGR